MPIFTCLSCHVAFKDGDNQREHFQSDWHRYNLKRKVAELPPITAEAFRDRVLALKAKADDESTLKDTYCSACKKPFSNVKSYENHLNSKKHIEKYKLKEARDKNPDQSTKKKTPTHTDQEDDEDDDEDIEVEEVDSDEWEGDPIPPTDCLFCKNSSPSIAKNLEHMTTVHSFFIPDVEYCVDVSEFLTYLGEKIGCGMECLYCGERSKHFSSIGAVQKHMIDKGHGKIVLEGERLVEFCQFYDYSTSYPDADETNPDAEANPMILSGDTYELTLPSGTVIGHRSLLRYYKQNLNPNRALAISKKGAHASALQKIMSQYRSLGWKEATKSDVAKRARDINYMKKIHSKHRLTLGVRANKLQNHFRPQVNF